MPELVTEYFTASELRCKCQICQGHVPHRVQFAALNALERVRQAFGKPIILTSAYRCPEHPVEQKKVAPGRHTDGIAFDILIGEGGARLQLTHLLLEAGFRGIGFYQNYIHADLRRNYDFWSRP